jgi:hypothetical protein
MISQPNNQNTHPDEVGVPQFCIFNLLASRSLGVDFCILKLPLPQPKPNSLELSTHQVQFIFHHPDPVQPFCLALHLSRALYTCRENSTNRPLFMQNEPNFHRGKNQPNPVSKKGLRKFYTPSDNEKRTQNEPNLLMDKIKCNLLYPKGLQEQTTTSPSGKRTQNEPNSNPISPPPNSPTFPIAHSRN